MYQRHNKAYVTQFICQVITGILKQLYTKICHIRCIGNVSSAAIQNIIYLHVRGDVMFILKFYY